ncbi:MAG: four helix bundle protein [Dissulfurispiraceae bacterium]
MHYTKYRIGNIEVWQKGIELADAIQKITDRLSSSGSCDIWGRMRRIAFSIPSYLAEAFTLKNIQDRKAHFCGALNCLDEILRSLALTERMGHIKKAHFHKIEQDIIELKSWVDLCER